MTFKIRICPVSDGTTSISPGLFNNGGGPADAAHPPINSPIEVVMRMSLAQINHVCYYLGTIESGADTSSVETAIDALN